VCVLFKKQIAQHSGSGSSQYLLWQIPIPSRHHYCNEYSRWFS